MDYENSDSSLFDSKDFTSNWFEQASHKLISLNDEPWHFSINEGESNDSGSKKSAIEEIQAIDPELQNVNNLNMLATMQNWAISGSECELESVNEHSQEPPHLHINFNKTITNEQSNRIHQTSGGSNNSSRNPNSDATHPSTVSKENVQAETKVIACLNRKDVVIKR